MEAAETDTNISFEIFSRCKEGKTKLPMSNDRKQKRFASPGQFSNLFPSHFISSYNYNCP